MKVITKVFLVFAAIGGGVISGCATKSEFKDLKNRMDALESNKIQSIEGQISSIDTSLGLLDQTDDQLEGYINALKGQVLELEVTEGEEREALEAAIKALQAEDESLHKQMEELKAYVDTELNGVKDWASATFVTLEEYNKTVDVITGIQAKVDSLHSDIAKEYEATINEAIEKTAKSMESWVNEQLTGYYDIATMNTKLDSLKSALEKQLKEQGGDLAEQIAQNTEDIEALESELEKTAEDITDAYEDAIKDAIEENNGTITQSIQNAIDGVNTKIKSLDERVSDLETAVGKLEDRMDEVERTLKNLASITYIPKYADFAERVKYVQRFRSYEMETIKDYTIAQTITLRFDVYPVECADSIVTAYNNAVEDKKLSPLSARAVYTLTKANAGDFVNLNITNVEAEKDKTTNKSTGVLSVTISPTALDRDFILGNLEASVVLKVSTGYSNIQSDYIRLVPDIYEFNTLYYSISTEETPVKLILANIYDDSADKIKVWKSENTTIATVDGNGNLTPVNPGTVDITAYDESENLIVTCNVLVYEPPFIPVESITCVDKLQITPSTKGNVTVTILPTNATDQRFEHWCDGDYAFSAFIRDGLTAYFFADQSAHGKYGSLYFRTVDGDKSASCQLEGKKESDGSEN